jgi:hypothetical protein
MAPRITFISCDGPGTQIECGYNNVSMISAFSEAKIVGIEGKNGARLTTHNNNFSIRVVDPTEILRHGRYFLFFVFFFSLRHIQPICYMVY